MNKKQLAYQIGRVIYNNYDALFLIFAGSLGYPSVHYFSKVQSIDDFASIGIGFGCGIWAIACSFEALKGGLARVLLHIDVKEIKGNKEEYPLECANTIIIDDSQGLEKLLEKTNACESRERGTFLNAYADTGRAVVHKVLDIEDGEKKGLIGYRAKDRIRLKRFQAEEEGYANGFHHYHPDFGPRWFGARGFTIGLQDRNGPMNWINLLTFNLLDGPEIIGFNKQFTYIPKDKTKKELILAKPKQIMEYLKS